MAEGTLKQLAEFADILRPREPLAPIAVPRVAPDAAFWSNDLAEFVLPYEAVRTAREPERALMAFLQSTYEAAADLGKWDRAALQEVKPSLHSTHSHS